MAEPKRFLLRLRPELFEALRHWADEDLRSINAQIEYLLTDQARRAGRLPSRHRRRPPQPSPDETDETDEPGDGDGLAGPAAARAQVRD